MNPADLLRSLSIDAAASRLEVHPFDVARILTVDGPLPADLVLDAASFTRVRRAGGLQGWWSRAESGASIPSNASAPEVVRVLLREMLARGVVEPAGTRADNLFRGVSPEVQRILRRAVNALIGEGYLSSRMTPTGLSVALQPRRVDDVRAFIERGSGPVADLAERDP